MSIPFLKSLRDFASLTSFGSLFQGSTTLWDQKLLLNSLLPTALILILYWTNGNAGFTNWNCIHQFLTTKMPIWKEYKTNFDYYIERIYGKIITCLDTSIWKIVTKLIKYLQHSGLNSPNSQVCKYWIFKNTKTTSQVGGQAIEFINHWSGHSISRLKNLSPLLRPEKVLRPPWMNLKKFFA